MNIRLKKKQKSPFVVNNQVILEENYSMHQETLIQRVADSTYHS